MYLIPEPKKIIMDTSYFNLSPHTPIRLDVVCSFEDLETALLLQSSIKEQLGYTLGITKTLGDATTLPPCICFKNIITSDEGYTLDITTSQVTIGASTSKGLFYGVQTLKQIIKQYGISLPCLSIEDAPLFKNRGFYHDITRGKVPTLETLKALVDLASSYKINQLQLYIEHTFAFQGMSEVWYDKSPLSPEDILLLDAYCQKRHIELIPSLSTFGHLYELLRTQTFKYLCELDASDVEDYSLVGRMRHHTLTPTHPDSIKVVQSMLEQFIPLFSSEYFNICCDETFDLGKGKTRDLAEKVGSGKLYTDFLNQIITLVKGHGKKVMFWSDIILHHPELLSDIPEDVICLTWNYEPRGSEQDVKTIAATSHPQYLCSGTLSWNRLMNNIEDSYTNISSMVKYGKQYGAIGLLNTDWGDYGHISLLGTSIPGMIMGAALSWTHSPTSFDDLCEAISLVEYGDTSKKLVHVLDAINKTQVVSWRNIIHFKERGNFVTVSQDSLQASYKKTFTLEQELMSFAPQLRHYPLALEEYLNATKGIRLFLALGSYILKEQDASIIPLEAPDTLAQALEVWYHSYQELWMKRNKVSEVHRIREVITYYCKWLRSK